MTRHTIKLNLGRHCLKYIIKAYNMREIYLPYYICPTLIKTAREEKCYIKFYHIDRNFYPALNFENDAYILYPNYFGICASNVMKLAHQYRNLIVDNAHNFYMPDCGLASFNSLRKFFAVRDGAILNISKTINLKIPKDTYSYKNFSRANTYNEFLTNELSLEHESFKIMSESTEKLFSQIDTEKEKQLRLERFNLLNKQYAGKNKLKINLTKYDVPFVYPYLIKDEETGKRLEKEGKIIIRYWQPLPEKFPEYDFYKYLIPIPLSR